MALNNTTSRIEKDSRPLPRCILFDAVGTLIYPSPSVVEVYQAIGRRHGVELSADDLEKRFAVVFVRSYRNDMATCAGRERERWRAIVCEVFYDHAAAGDAVFDDLWRHFAQPQSWRLFDDVPAALAELQAAGFQLGIASNFDNRLARVCQGHAALRDLRLFCASDVGFVKPDRRFFDAVARRLDRSPEQIMLVGDHPAEDIRGATDAGWQAVIIERHEDISLHAKMHRRAVASLLELPALLAADRPT